jgi:hypothetical protein
VASLGGLAGCTSAGSSDSAGSATVPSTGGTTAPGRDDEVPPSGGSTDPEVTSTGGDASEPTGSPTSSTPELDLREANVVDVQFEPRDGAFRFSVTLLHDDDGEDGYADWWQVETSDGERLGRRELLHAHGTEPFTRSGTVDVPPGVTCVVVRGHDQTHGYGGRAILVTLDSGATRGVDQGVERREIGSHECP